MKTTILKHCAEKAKVDDKILYSFIKSNDCETPRLLQAIAECTGIALNSTEELVEKELKSETKLKPVVIIMDEIEQLTTNTIKLLKKWAAAKNRLFLIGISNSVGDKYGRTIETNFGVSDPTLPVVIVLYEPFCIPCHSYQTHHSCAKEHETIVFPTYDISDLTEIIKLRMVQHICLVECRALEFLCNKQGKNGDARETLRVMGFAIDDLIMKSKHSNSLLGEKDYVEPILKVKHMHNGNERETPADVSFLVKTVAAFPSQIRMFLFFTLTLATINPKVESNQVKFYLSGVLSIAVSLASVMDVILPQLVDSGFITIERYDDYDDYHGCGAIITSQITLEDVINIPEIQEYRTHGLRILRHERTQREKLPTPATCNANQSAGRSTAIITPEKNK